MLAVTLARPEPHKPRFPSEVDAAITTAVGRMPHRKHCTDAAEQLALPKDDADDTAVLCTAVDRLARAAGLKANMCEHFQFEGTFVVMWRLHRGSCESCAER